MYVGLPNFYGAWLLVIYGHTQHAGPGRERARPPAELPHGLHERRQPLPVLEHELPRRAPHVPAGALPRSAQAARTGQGRHARAYNGLLEAYREIIPAVLRQAKDPTYFVQTPAARAQRCRRDAAELRTRHRQRRPAGRDGWIEVGDGSSAAERRRAPLRPRPADLRHLPHRRRQVLCHRRPLHARQRPSGRRFGDGHARSNAPSTTAASTSATARRSGCRSASALKTYPVPRTPGRSCSTCLGGWLGVTRAAATLYLPRGQQRQCRDLHQGAGAEAGAGGSPPPEYQPGDYLQFDIPAYAERSLREIDVELPLYRDLGDRESVFDLQAATRSPVGAIIRWPATPPRTEQCASTSAWPRRRRA